MKVFAGFIINAQTLLESGFYKGRSKEVKIVYRLSLVNCYLLNVPRLPFQPASTGGRLSDCLNRLELA